VGLKPLKLIKPFADERGGMAFEVSLRLVIRNRHDFSEIKFDRKILLDWKVVHLSLVCDSCVILLS